MKKTGSIDKTQQSVSHAAPSTADASPSSSINVKVGAVNMMSQGEKEVRENFRAYCHDIVAKNGGDAGNKKDISFEAIESRAAAAIIGAKQYKSVFKSQSEYSANERSTSRVDRQSMGGNSRMSSI